MKRFLLIFGVFYIFSCSDQKEINSTSNAADQKEINSTSTAAEQLDFDKIEYSFHDKSVSPDYQRNFKWVITKDSIQFIVDSYNKILQDTIIKTPPNKWEQCKADFFSCGIKNKKQESETSLTGGTGVSIRTFLGTKETFSGFVYEKSYGDMIGDIDKLLLTIQLGIDSNFYQIR
jgi:hypothetical protein